MEMTTHEIVRMYKDAADKKKQITILAQMNLCTPEEIRDELIKGGIDARTLPRKRKKLGEKVAETTVVPETTPALDAETKAVEQAPAVLIPIKDAALVREALLFYVGDVNKELNERRAEVNALEAAAAEIVRIVGNIEKQTTEAQHDPIPR